MHVTRSGYCPGGMVYHVLNRGVGRRTLFHKDQDFLAFERVVEESLRTCRMRICAYCLLSNHWHRVLWPESDGDLPGFMQQMTNMHVKRWKEHRHEIGYGHLYQGRYKSFPVESEDYFYQVVRYVERNALARTWLRGGGVAVVKPAASGGRGSGVSNSFRVAAATPQQLAGNREPPAVRGRVERFASMCPTWLSLWKCRMDGRDREAIENRVNITPSWKTEEGKLTLSENATLLSLCMCPRFGGRHLFCS